MKAIILISSIFYILGLKIGNKIDISPGATEVKEKTLPKMTEQKSEDTFILKSETEGTTHLDSIKNNSSEKDLLNNS
jgi:hypothetical protein